MEGVGDSSSPRSTSRVDSFALAGFVAGEGSFIVTTAQPPFEDGTPRLRFVFQVTVAERDRALLEQLQARLGFGSIHVRAPSKPHWQPQATLTVASIKAHRAATLPFFDQHLLVSAKRDQYLLWRQALLSWDAIRPSKHRRGPSPCSEPGCDRPVRGRGLCRIHYYRVTGY